ncbi:MAG: VCBS repeat-containing protein [Planctomycetes bacterium]|nr:VCBS repeat-containing protein [Planctomycetota bacterium]
MERKFLPFLALQSFRQAFRAFRPRVRYALGFGLAAALVLVAWYAWSSIRLPIPRAHLEAVLEAHNRGVGLMDQYRYKDAVPAFETVVRLAPRWPVGHINLGLALLNEQKDFDRARLQFQEAARLAPTDPRPVYGLAMLAIHLFQDDEALGLLQQVLQLDPEDSDSLLWIGQIYFRRQAFAEARPYYEAALARNASLVAAHQNLSICLRLLHDPEKGAANLSAAIRLKEAGQGTEVLRAIEYPLMGKYAETVRIGVPGPQRRPHTRPEASPRFSDATAESGIEFTHDGETLALTPPGPGEASRSLGAAAACADFDGDGHLDVFLCGGRPASASSRLFLNDGRGRFRDAISESGLPPALAGIGAAPGDYDNDGRIDLFVTGEGRSYLFHQTAPGRFTDVSEETRTSCTGLISTAASFADMDNDGDLDLLVAHAAPAPDQPPLSCLVNRQDGRFQPHEKPFARPGPGRLALGCLLSDLDNDGDADALLFDPSVPSRYLVNRRLDGMVESDGGVLVREARTVLSGCAADLDGDEAMDLVLFRGPGQPVLMLRNFPPGTFTEPFESTQARATSGACFDADNDGDEDLFLLDAPGGSGPSLALLANDGNGHFADVSSAAGLDSIGVHNPRSALYADFDEDGDVDVLILNSARPATFLRNNTPTAHRFVRFVLTGSRMGEQTRSSSFPLGVQVFVQAGAHHQKKELFLAAGYLSQLSPQVTFGLGAAAKVDVARFVWPDGIIQSEMELAAGQAYAVAETLRKTGSCPVLFAWNGERFDFVTDFLGGGGLGFLVAPGSYALPQPIERVRMSPAQLKPSRSGYEIRIVEPLEEAVYLDHLQLIAADHPAGIEVFPDERFETGPPPRREQLWTLQRRIPPIRAATGHSPDVLGVLIHMDRRTVSDFRTDPRFLGLAETHTLEMDFGDAFTALPSGVRVVLCLYGWVEYPYSQSLFAASQAGARLEPPSLQIPGDHDSWRTVLPETGYPAGLPKMMTLDVTPWAAESRGRFRLVTNMQIYWDAVFAAADSGSPLRCTALDPTRATLRRLGFPREFSPDGRLPTLLDYHLIDPNPGFKLMAGRYTRYGDVRALLADPDDCFAIFGRGEEIALTFEPDALPDLPDGWARTFILHADGYCKDMDPYTACGQTVEPLPFHGMSAYPYPGNESYPDDPLHRAYQGTYNTRVVPP